MNRLAVLLPLYNGVPFVLETLSSLQRQSHREFTLYIVDDASTDGSVDAVRSVGDDRFHVIRGETNLGIPGNWNRALMHVETPYFALVHQDDVYEPEFLGTLLGLLEAHPDAFIAHCAVRAIDEQGADSFIPAERYKETLWPAGEPSAVPPRAAVERLARGNYVVMSAVIYRTAAVRALGPFDERLRFVADWQYWLRGALSGYRIAATRRRLVRRRWHHRMATRRFEADLTRYREEVELARWIATEAHTRGFRTTADPDYTTVSNAVLSEVATRLAAGRRAEAARLLEFAAHDIPGFRASARHLAAAAAQVMGRPGGWLLALARASYLRAISLGRL